MHRTGRKTAALTLGSMRKFTDARKYECRKPADFRRRLGGAGMRDSALHPTLGSWAPAHPPPTPPACIGTYVYKIPSMLIRRSLAGARGSATALKIDLRELRVAILGNI